MSLRRTAFLAFVLFAVATAFASAQEWERLGTRVVDFHGDHDAILCAGEGAFTAIRIDVDFGEVEMYNIKLTFGDGQTFSPDTRVQFKEGSRSRSIDLPGGARSIRRVDFWYGTPRQLGRTTVTLFGLKPGGIIIGQKPPLDAYPGWEILGTRMVDYGIDKDVILVGTNEGRFKSILLEVLDGDVEIFNILVTFGNNEVFSAKTRLVFEESTRTRAVDFPGEGRVIRKIEFFYRSLRSAHEGKATVRVFGKK